ncbi:YlxR family protein [Lipingzhangella sp. LS1_29]|uniref:YlxR family protein n=1 Tax=Lipingzhangella rawalii TaxID=2055835 RepID=A0ABU2H6T7_9ACTN|nr:YlxR family protein [Lipingzhangella rawalii]MDS1270564.1 YlxR family protein [Lipingzhangella rawalii]
MPRSTDLPHGPVRTCVGCRKRDAQENLLRIVLSEARLQPDPNRRAPGRGAYLHLDWGCWTRAERRRPWTRVLRSTSPVNVHVDTAMLRTYLATRVPRTDTSVAASG